MIKVAFIVCYDNELFVRECLNYISFLKIPEGVEIEVVGICDADSMASGYNAAMREVDAKYKVYLHQDVFILNENFIQDFITIFERHPEYGMLGVCGSNVVIPTGNYRTSWNVGTVCVDDSLRESILSRKNEQQVEEVVVIDGMLMVTQYDVPWRENIFDGFAFYDIAQSIEFYKNGYKVGVPYQESAWCNHVCGHEKVDKDDIYRKRFCTEYAEFGYYYQQDAASEENELKSQEVEKIVQLACNALEEGQLGKMEALLNVAMEFYPYNTKLCNLYHINLAIQAERQDGRINGFYQNGMSAEQMLEKYLLRKFLLKRMETGMPIDDMSYVLESIVEDASTGLASEKVIAEHAVVSDERVVWKLKRILEENYQKTYQVQFDNKPFAVPSEDDYEQVRYFCENVEKNVCQLEIVGDTEDYEPHKKQIETVLGIMEEVHNAMHIGRMEENLYMAYFDVIERSKHMSLFVEQCRRWLERVQRYIGREEREPLVSVLTSVYNGEAFVEDTLRSIMNQSYKNLQIIVVDDCSSDQSRRIIERLAMEDKRIQTLYLKENSNVCRAVNMGYELARGKYLAHIGHDDIWKPDKIEKQVHFMEMNQEYAACFTLCDIIDDDKEICNMQALELYQVFDERNRSQREWINMLLFTQNVFCTPSVLIRKKCIEGERLYHLGIVQLQDFALWLELLEKYPLFILQERLTLYRKFIKKGSNLSAFNESTRNRLRHERSFILAKYIMQLSDKELQMFLQERFRDKSASTSAELACERAFILLDVGDVHSIDMFMELFENDETRVVLESKYNFKLCDFYAINSQTFSYDDEGDYQLAKANAVIRQYQEIIKKQNEVIEEQKRMLQDKK